MCVQVMNLFCSVILIYFVWMLTLGTSFFIMGAIVSLVPAYLYATPIFDIEISAKLPFFLVASIVVAVILSSTYNTIALNSRTNLATSRYVWNMSHCFIYNCDVTVNINSRSVHANSDVLEQIEALESIMTKEYAQLTVYSRFLKQSEFFACFVTNSLFLVTQCKFAVSHLR